MPPMAQNKPMPEDKKALHSGHRQRLKEQFLKHGLDSLHDINVLELALFYAIPRQDTNPIAHRLLDRFGSLDRVFDASMEELITQGQLTENAAILLKLIPAVARRQQLSRSSFDNILDTTRRCGDYLAPFFFGATDEVVYLLGLDAKCKVLGCIELFQGTVNYAHLSIRRVVEEALKMKATSVVLAHNHTSGIAVPSQEDIETTRAVAHALDLVGILLADHIVVADDDYVSMAESGLM